MTKKLTTLEKFATIFQYSTFEFDLKDELKESVTEALTQGVSDGYIKSFVLLDAEHVGSSVFIKVMIDENEKEYRIVINRETADISDILG